MSSYRNPPGSGGAPMTPTGSGNVSQRNASRSPTPAGRGSPSAAAVSGASKGQQGGGGVGQFNSGRYKPQPISPERGTSHRSFEDSTTDGVLSKQVDLRDSLNRKSESRRLAYSQQVWPLTQFFFCLASVKKSSICLEGKSLTPRRGDTLSSVAPSNSLLPVSDP